MNLFLANPEVQVVALCDVPADMIERARQRAPEARGFADHKKLLEMKDLDAVLTATPDHWHAACAIDAVNGGKDVYVEKPLTLTIEEGPAIVKAARATTASARSGCSSTEPIVDRENEDGLALQGVRSDHWEKAISWQVGPYTLLFLVYR